ncbi:MAG: HEAT repeat domain-containing protein [Deltaproteobacteria bacterium]|nr:HEAT repeat domain-containing protein [Deltaproteobacteria bacterium]
MLAISATSTPQATPLRQRAGAEAWLAALRDADPQVRRSAAWRLGAYGPPGVGLAIADRLRDAALREPDPSAGMAMVWALATGRHPESYTRLLDLARRAQGAQEHPAVLGATLRALGALTTGQDAALQVLLQAARHDNADAPGGPEAEAAVLALASLPDDALDTTIRAARNNHLQLAGTFQALGLRADPRRASLLLEHLRARAPTAETSAVEALGALRTLESVELLAQRLRSDRDPRARRAAVRALGRLPGAADPLLLARCLEEPPLRQDALRALGALGAPSSVSSIVPWLSAPLEADRVDAAQALGALGAPQAAPPLLARLPQEPSRRVRVALWRAALRADPRATLPALARNSSAPEARWTLVEAGLQGHSVPCLPGDDTASRWTRAFAGQNVPFETPLGSSSQTRLSLALVQRSAGGGPHLGWWHTEDQEEVRAALALALGDSTGEGRDALTRDVLAEDDPGVALLLGASGLARQGHGAVVPALRRWLRSPRALVRATAAAGLGWLGDRASALALEVALAQETDPQARGALALALAAVEGPGALPALEVARRTAWTRDLDAMVRRALERARRGGGPWRFEGTGLVRLEAVPPGSVWAVGCPDGSWRFGVASEDGVALIPGAPSADSPLQRVDTDR